MAIRTRRLRNGKTAYDVELGRPDGTKYSKTFHAKRDAQAWEAEQRAARRSACASGARATSGAASARSNDRRERRRWDGRCVGARPSGSGWVDADGDHLC